ncbi:MAG: PIN domain-containing protein [Acidimicrobiia bacterium]
MTLLVDSGPLVAYADRLDPHHERVRTLIRAERQDLVVPATVTAEADYLLGSRIGAPARLAFYQDIAAGRLRVECLDAGEHATVADLHQRYRDLDPGLADLSIVVLAFRFGTRRILTFDERDFRALRPIQGGAFSLLPADA